MNRHVSAISGRLSLRPPQRESLEILDRLTDLLALGKDRDLQSDLEKVRQAFPSVTDFERDFPSVCFALATGVGKTRLMGAFIAYLYLAKNMRHFFVLAPSLTIYEKLIRDFTPGTPKYVFQGIAEFTTDRPEIITGENYAAGRGVRERDLFGATNAHINVFNISKINTEVRGGRMPRIKRLSEYIGQSYFDYLAALDDLVLLMDESHRYRGDAGFRALNELKPVLGLEVTATPHAETSTGIVPFKNIIYSYPLANAMRDGFVKEPAVATRENFDPDDYSEEQLEDLKLRDGIVIHENVKTALKAHALNSGTTVVKPFVLVVARDTTHANELLQTIRSDDFYGGEYRDKVITIHSKQTGEEGDENVQRLLAVEDPEEATEIVIHVNMLKEGWDVTNLYTIIPLRAARVRTLVEQTIGRGLRLPYGRRTGIMALDTLTIVAHDEFDEIVKEANRPDSVIRRGVIIGRDLPAERRTVVTVKPLIDAEIRTTRESPTGATNLLFPTKEEQDLALAAFQIINRFERIPSISGLRSEKVQAELRQEIADTYVPSQAVLEGLVPKADLAQVVDRTTRLIEKLTIAIPRITLWPKGEVQRGYSNFDLDVSGIRPQPVSENVLIQFLRTADRERLLANQALFTESRVEDYLVRVLIDCDDVDYDRDADLLYKLSGQMVNHLNSYLKSEKDLHNVLQYHQGVLADAIHSQMQQHYWEKAEAGYEARISRGFLSLRDSNFSMPADEAVRDFREPVEEKQLIRGMLFGGFQKCLYPQQKFDSDAERRFAVICEADPEVQKWFKPAPSFFRIDFKPETPYEPDFVVETAEAKLLCEPKRVSEMNDPIVRQKTEAAVEWCRYATEHELKNDGKPWKYLLIPHDSITSNSTLGGLAARFTVGDG